MFDKKQKIFVKRIHLVTDDGLYDRKAFYKIKIVFYSSSMNDGKFIAFAFNAKSFAIAILVCFCFFVVVFFTFFPSRHFFWTGCQKLFSQRFYFSYRENV